MKTHSNITQLSPEWHELKRGKLSASRATAITAKNGLGKGAETLAIEIMVEQLGVPMDNYVSPAMEFGLESEGAAREAYEAATGSAVLEVGGVENNGLWWSPDGLAGFDGAIEIKCPQPKAHLATILSGKMPAEHMAQVQFGLMVSGRAWIDFVSYNMFFPDGLELFVVRVERDGAYIDMLQSRAKEFERMVKEMETKLKTIQG